jgi:hypothetical protein
MPLFSFLNAMIDSYNKTFERICEKKLFPIRYIWCKSFYKKQGESVYEV